MTLIRITCPMEFLKEGRFSKKAWLGVLLKNQKVTMNGWKTISGEFYDRTNIWLITPYWYLSIAFCSKS